MTQPPSHEEPGEDRAFRRNGRVGLKNWVAGTSLALLAVGLAACSGTREWSERYPGLPGWSEGFETADPYWALETPSEMREEWLRHQATLTAEFFEASRDTRDTFLARLQELKTMEDDRAVSSTRGGRVFIRRGHSLWFRDAADGPEVQLLHGDQRHVPGVTSAEAILISPDGSQVLHGVSNVGTTLQRWSVLDVRTRKESDSLQWRTESAPVWLPDSSGYLYTDYRNSRGFATDQAVDQMPKLMLHRLGEPQVQDRFVFELRDVELGGIMEPRITADRSVVCIRVRKGLRPRDEIYLALVSDLASGAIPLLTGFDAAYSLVGHAGTELFFRTDLDAPLGRLIAVEVADGAPYVVRELVPEAEGLLRGAVRVGEKLVLHHLVHGTSRLEVRSLDGRLERELGLPELGLVENLAVDGKDGSTLKYDFSSLKRAPSAWSWVPGGAQQQTDSTHGHRATIADLDSYFVERTFVEAEDGVGIPVLVAGRTSVASDGDAIAILEGYGAFGHPVGSEFRADAFAWMEQGGLHVVAGTRGGGEYGRRWHEAGMSPHRQRVTDDFLAVAEWLVHSGRVRAGGVGIYGESAGGLLVGEALTQRPKLFGGATPVNGLFDMKRYAKAPLARYWLDEFGLHSHSPLEALAGGGCYPPTLVTVGAKDNTVAPWHGYKFLAGLQLNDRCAGPQLLNSVDGMDHDARAPETRADRLSFLATVLRTAADAGGP